MKKHLPIFIILLLINLAAVTGSLAQGEAWRKTDSTYAMGAPSGLGVDDNRNVYVVAFGVLLGHSFPQLVKYNAAGAFQWRYTYSGVTGYIAINKTITDGAGNTYLACSTVNGTYDALLIKINANGTKDWEQLLNCDNGYDDFSDVVVDASGNVYATGTSVNNTTGDQRVMLTKFNAAGNVQWTQFYFVAGKASVPEAVKIDPASGNIVVGGYERENSNYWWGQVAVFTPAGNVSFGQNINPGNTYGFSFKSLQVDASGNIYAIGNVDTIIGGGGAFSNYGVVVAKLNNTGNIQWIRKYFQNNYRMAKNYCSGMDANGVVYLGGYHVANNVHYGNYQAIDPATGDTLWHKQFGINTSGNWNYMTDMVVGSNTIYFTATYTGIGTGYDFFTAKANTSDGSLTWSTTYNGFANSTDEPAFIKTDNTGDIIITGKAREYSASSYANTTIKYAYPAGINEKAIGIPEVTVYPQPFQNNVYLKITANTADKAVLKVYDTQGSLILDNPALWLNQGENLINQNTSLWASGAYTYTLQTSTSITSGRLICVK